jgi:dTDP-4-dehydrorhamnose reductase
MSKRYLVTGASGQLGGYLLRELHGRGSVVVAWSGSRRGELFGVPLQPVDLADPDAVAPAFRACRPDIVLHAAAIARLAECFRDPEQAQRVNTRGTATLAGLAAEANARLVHVSTDLVFDGESGGYREEDVPSPTSIYGQSKLAAEEAARLAPRSIVARVSLLFGPSVVGRPSFFDEQIGALRAGRPIPLFVDEWRTPLSLSTAARALVDLAESDEVELLHLGGPERLSRLEMGLRLAEFLQADPAAIVATQRDRATAAEPRPRDVSLDSSLWRKLFPATPWPNYREALAEMARMASGLV